MAVDWEAKAKEFQEALMLTSKQSSETLERLGGFRVGVVTVLHRAYPGIVAGIEKSLGGRLADLPDSVLLGYMEALSTMVQDGKITAPNDLGEIRRALRDSGFPMDDEATALEMGLAIREGFAAAKKRNQNLRSGQGAAGKGRGGAAGIKRDLGWAEPQNFAGVKTGVQKPPPKQAPHPSPAGKKNKKPTSLPLFQTPSGKPTGEQNGSSGQVKDKFDELAQSVIPDSLKANLQPPVDEPVKPSVSEAAVYKSLETRLQLPSPVFMRDVVQILGSASAASDWEQSQRGAGRYSFINAQGKHRQRGSLILPAVESRGSIAGYAESTWGRALAAGYSGGRTYDLAVVFAILGDTVLAASFSRFTVEITYRGPSGVEALVVALAPGPDPWLEAEKSVAELVTTGGFSSVTVVSCQQHSAQKVSDALQSAVQEPGWKGSGQILVSQLTEWVVDRGRNSYAINF